MNFVFVGFGSVAFGLLEVFNKEKLYLENKFTIIDPRDKTKELNYLRKNNYFQLNSNKKQLMLFRLKQTLV